jgi:hypothetical protein
MPMQQRHQIQRQWVEHAAIFFITSVKGITEDDFYDAVDRSMRAFDLGHSGARSIFFGYDLARQRGRDNARGNHND